MKAAEIRRMETWKPGFADAMLKEIASQLAEIHELLEQMAAPPAWYIPTTGGLEEVPEGGEPRQLRVGPPPAKKSHRKGGK